MLVEFSTATIGTLTRIFDLLPHWLSALSGIIASASAVAALTPTPKDDSVLGKIYRVVDFLALNIGHAKDAGAPPKTRP
jgi:hypothetical protein